MNWTDFKAQVESAGFKAKDCGGGHWQILGGLVPVNFYPEKPCVYVCGAQKGIRGKRATVDNALKFAQEGTIDGNTKVPRKDLSNNRRKRIKFILFKKDPHCHWCRVKFSGIGRARLDHKVPLDQGGSHREDNLVLACEVCDKKRGNKAINPANREAAVDAVFSGYGT